MKLIIAGGRGYELTPSDIASLNAMLMIANIEEVITGGASGADSHGAEWARMLNIPVKIFSADWDTYGKSAGPIRNRKMAEYGDAVILFPGGRGTENMHNCAIDAGIRIHDWRERSFPTVD